ncbi:hypothetical protein PG637_10260 [Riemerella anatipestifer]|nr:hypothetical protein [Riemerella anatipestifer]MDY3326050.1 hypothetical protein [Riemerella anatipestifer]MDY3354400.1 hypothetical protein [Riemerella anatipestifer]
MYLIYAYGTGLGHLKRVSDFINQQSIPVKDCIIVTQSQFGYFWEKDWTVIKLPRSTFCNALQFEIEFKKILCRFPISEVIVDVFPEGFFGELGDCLSLFKGKKVLLARILSNEYFKKYPSNHIYNEVFLTESGIDIENYSCETTTEIEIKYQNSKQTSLNVPKSSYSVIIHSQPLQEVKYLYQMARMYTSEQIVIFTTILEDNLLANDSVVFKMQQPPLGMLEKANKIFSGTGYNAVKMLKKFHNKTVFIPFPREYDNQFLRKKLLNKCTI